MPGGRAFRAEGGVGARLWGRGQVGKFQAQQGNRCGLGRVGKLEV